MIGAHQRLSSDKQRKVIAAMAFTRSPEDIAEAMDLPLSEVVAVLGNKAKKWVARNHKTGVELIAYSERAAYCRVQIKGWMPDDWGFVKA